MDSAYVERRKHSRNLLREIRAYTYICDEEGNVKDRVDPTCHDHALDALRYALSMDNALTYEHFHEPIFFTTDEDYSTNPAE